MQKYKLLDLMIEDSKIQNGLYKPTSLWKACSQRLTHILETNSMGNFRNLKTSRSFLTSRLGI